MAGKSSFPVGKILPFLFLLLLLVIYRIYKIYVISKSRKGRYFPSERFFPQPLIVPRVLLEDVFPVQSTRNNNHCRWNN